MTSLITKMSRISEAVEKHIKSTGQCVGPIEVGGEKPEIAHHLEDNMFHPGDLDFHGLKYNYNVCCGMGGDIFSFWTCCKNDPPNVHAKGCRSVFDGMPSA